LPLNVNEQTKPAIIAKPTKPQATTLDNNRIFPAIFGFRHRLMYNVYVLANIAAKTVPFLPRLRYSNYSRVVILYIIIIIIIIYKCKKKT